MIKIINLHIHIFLVLIIFACGDINGLKNDLTKDIQDSRESIITKAIESVSKSVVGINVTQLKKKTKNSYWDPFWGGMFPRTETYKVENFGSGLIISSDGYIITNAHVVENAHEIIINLTGGDRYEAELIGEDKITDLALLKIDGINENNFSVPKIGSSDDLILGEWVVALGNPLGLFNISNEPVATIGIVSGKDINFGQKQSGHVYQNMIQTDASINPGNSGGPLINSLGEVVGINTFIITSSDYSQGSIGLGFAIPIGRVRDVVGDLKEYGKVDRSYTTGIRVQSIDHILMNYLRLDSEKGVIVIDVEKRSAGERAGLKIGDVIVRVDDSIVNSANDIVRIIDENFHKSGDMVDLDIIRNQEHIKLKIQLEEPKSNKHWGF